MKVSKNWLQTFFDAPLPTTEAMVDALTFHSSEIEDVEELDGDTVLDVKVLPDKSAWIMSHRGVAREIATIMELPMNDPLAFAPALTPVTDAVTVSIDTDGCTRYAAAVLTGVTVGSSPEWLQKRLAAIGQRSINNVVDATNYVMFHVGQPLHAFDGTKLTKEHGAYALGVRQATAGEGITTLSGDELTLTTEDMVIIDRNTDTPVGIAGVKGGRAAEVTSETTELVIEAANFDRAAVRKTSQRLRLRTDASARYENGVVPELVAYGLAEVVRLIGELAGGTCVGYVDVFPRPRTVAPVSVSLERINSMLGLTLSKEDIDAVLARFEYAHTWTDAVVTVTPPFERDDLIIPEDVIEEIGRIYGLAHIPSITPDPIPLTEFNTSFYYADEVRITLIGLGFSEVFTSSFRNNDTVALANALAADKGYLRSSLRENLAEALVRNVPNRDLLGLPYIAIFEIGTVFAEADEHMSLAFGVRTAAAYNAKQDDPMVKAAMDALANVLGFEHYEVHEGIAEVNLSEAISDLPAATAYTPFTKRPDANYKPFSLYPSMSRDIALWVPEDTPAEAIMSLLNEHAGDLRVRTTLFDEFKKDGRVSYAFRLVFQSNEKTLTDEAVNQIMDRIYQVVSERGLEVR
jgi:phenylalanyl-tRNA synthetase beta chain